MKDIKKDIPQEQTEVINPIFPDGLVKNVKTNHQMMNTGILLGALVVIFVILKKFIYVKDEKRHGK